jgi:hypothetical protein
VALSLTAVAQAQSESIVQIKSSFLRNPADQSSLVIGLKADAAVPEADNNANFRQHWRRVTVGPSTYTFQSRLFSQNENGCLKVPDATSPSSSLTPVTLGSCSSPRARWRMEFRGGPGHVLVNADGTGHALSPSQCPLGVCDPRVSLVRGIFIKDWVSLIGWSFDFL